MSHMTRINDIEKALLQLEGGRFQKLGEAFVFNELGLTRYSALGSQAGTDKTTVGVPDASGQDEEGLVTLVAFTTAQDPFSKLKDDINDCLDEHKASIPNERIGKIISFNTRERLTEEETQELEALDPRVRVIGLKEIARTIENRYPVLAHDYLGLSMGSGSVITRDDFIAAVARNTNATPFAGELIDRDDEIQKLRALLDENQIVVVYGNAGCGKTKLCIDAAYQYAEDRRMEFVAFQPFSDAYADEDISHFIRNAENMVVFVDDANTFTVLDHLINAAQLNSGLKLVLTARIGSYQAVVEKARRIERNGRLLVGAMQEPSIRKILTAQYGIVNETYIKKILRIAKGSARLAVMAGKVSRDGYERIANPFDLHEEYLKPFLASITEREEEILSTFAVFEVVCINDDDPACARLAGRGICVDEQKACARKLLRMEVVDVYEYASTNDFVVRFEDQNIRDYYVYKAFMGSSSFVLSEFIVEYIGHSDNIVPKAINSMLAVFGNEELLADVKQHFELAWRILSASDEETQESFMRVAHTILDERALAYAHKRVCGAEEKDFSDSETFRNDRVHGTSFVLGILVGTIRKPSFELALPVLIECVKRGSEDPSCYRQVFKSELSYKPESSTNGFKCEIELLEAMWTEWQSSKNGNVAACLLLLLGTYIQITNQGMVPTSDRQFDMYHIVLTESDALRALRDKCFEVAGAFIQEEPYERESKRMIADYCHTNSRFSDGRDVIANDINAIERYVLPHLDVEKASDCMVLRNAADLCQRLELEPMRFCGYQENTAFCAFSRFCDHEDDIAGLVDEIVGEWDDVERDRLFDYIAEADDAVSYDLDRAIGALFEAQIEKMPEGIPSLLERFMVKCGNARRLSPAAIHALIEALGYENLRHFVSDVDCEWAPVWLSDFDNLIPDSSISPDSCNEMIGGLCSEPLSLRTIVRITKREPDFGGRYVRSLCEEFSDDLKVIMWMFHKYGLESRAAAIDLSVFAEDADAIERAYMMAFEGSPRFDPNGEILMALIRLDGRFVLDFIDLIEALPDNGFYHSAYDSFGLLNNLWQEGITYERAESIIDYLWENHRSSFPYRLAQLFVLERGDGAISETKQSILKTYIEKNIDDVGKISYLSNVFRDYPEAIKRELFVNILLLNPSAELVRRLKFFASGSSADEDKGFGPHILSEIGFIESIVALLPNDAAFLVCREALNDLIQGKKAEYENEKKRHFMSRY